MSEHTEAKRICKKCLLRDLDESTYYKELKEYLEQLDEEDKAEQVLYEQRLAACKECDYLNAGMCRACGCYVEMRAAMKGNRCPYKNW